jgi:predicted peptidase
MRNVLMVFGYMFLAASSCEAGEIDPGGSETTTCKTCPSPSPIISIVPGPVTTVTVSPKPAPTVTVTATPSPKLTPCMCAPMSPSPSPSPEIAKLTAKPLGTVSGSPFGYMEYLPANYSKAAAASLPIIIHLHGIGERIGGENGTTDRPLSVTANFGPYASYAKAKSDFPAIILMPQAKKLSLWGAADVEAFIALSLKNYKANPKRVYLFGLSLGGYGVNSCMNVASCAAKVAAAVSICPGNMFGWIGGTNIVANKIHYFGAHAEDDTVVTIQAKQDASMKNLAGVLGGAQVTNRPDLPNAATGYNSSTGCWDSTTKKFVWLSGQTPGRGGSPYCFTSYSQGGHGIWGRVYADPALYTWALSKAKP